MTCRWWLLLFVLPILLVAREGRAQDAFEIQVYDASVDEPGHAGLELHLNYVASGLKEATPPELPSDHFFHATLEPSIGITRNFELGAYLQGAAGPDNAFGFAGTKIRAKLRIPCNDHWTFALNGELSYVPSRYEPNIWGGELRPVIEYMNGHVLVDVNPILSFDWTGPFAGIPHLEPCAALRYRLGERWMIGAEYYAALGPVSAIAPLHDQYHAAFVTGDVALPQGFSIHLGVGGGLTSATNPFVITSIVGKDF